MIVRAASITEHGAERDRWLLSYADLLTLLLAFFVVMYSVSAVNEKKLHDLASHIDAALTGSTVNNSEIPTSMSAARSTSAEKVSLLDVVNTLKLESVDVDVSADNWLEFNIDSTLLFESGGAELKAESTEKLDYIRKILATAEGKIRVEGHTDDIPINSEKYPSNWELSAARAAAVVRFLEARNIASARLAAIGFADSSPVALNDTAQGREENRRVVVKILYQEISTEAFAQMTALKEAFVDREQNLSEFDQSEFDNTFEETDELVEQGQPDTVEIDKIDPELLMQVLKELEKES